MLAGMHTTEATTHSPYRIADHTWIVPETVPAAPGTVVAINSMVITGREPVLVDTGAELSRPAWLDATFSVVDPGDVRWIFLSHDDADHVGNLPAVLELCPQATLVTNWFTVERLCRTLALPLHRMRWVNDGESFDVGDRRLHALVPPVFDSPTTRGLFDPTTGVYWAVDAFASLQHAHVTDTAAVPGELWRESFLANNSFGAPWHALVDREKFDRHVDRTAGLPISTIAAAHTAPIRGRHVPEAFRLIRQLARMELIPPPGQALLDEILAAALAEPAALAGSEGVV